MLITVYRFEIGPNCGEYITSHELQREDHTYYVLTTGEYSPYAIIEKTRKFYDEQKTMEDALTVAQFQIELEYCL